MNTRKQEHEMPARSHPGILSKQYWCDFKNAKVVCRNAAIKIQGSILTAKPAPLATSLVVMCIFDKRLFMRIIVTCANRTMSNNIGYKTEHMRLLRWLRSFTKEGWVSINVL